MGQRFVHRGFYQKIVYLSTMDQLKNIANFTLDLSSVEVLTDKKKNKKKKNEKKEKQPMQTTKIIEETDSAVLL
jgi:hypothetical protein